MSRKFLRKQLEWSHASRVGLVIASTWVVAGCPALQDDHYTKVEGTSGSSATSGAPGASLGGNAGSNDSVAGSSGGDAGSIGSPEGLGGEVEVGGTGGLSAVGGHPGMGGLSGTESGGSAGSATGGSLDTGGTGGSLDTGGAGGTVATGGTAAGGDAGWTSSGGSGGAELGGSGGLPTTGGGAGTSGWGTGGWGTGGWGTGGRVIGPVGGSGGSAGEGECGDGVVQGTEECDSGTVSVVGCTSDCTIDCSELYSDAVAYEVEPGHLHCIYTTTMNRTWEQSVARCEEDRAHLATITSDGEQAAALDALGNDDDVWIGATDGRTTSEFAFGPYQWVTDEAWDYEPAEGFADQTSPACYLDCEHCAALQNTGQWQAATCSDDLVPLCEWEPPGW